MTAGPGLCRDTVQVNWTAGLVQAEDARVVPGCHAARMPREFRHARIAMEES